MATQALDTFRQRSRVTTNTRRSQTITQRIQLPVVGEVSRTQAAVAVGAVLLVVVALAARGGGQPNPGKGTPEVTIT